jgi:hypothetical protein
MRYGGGNVWQGGYQRERDRDGPDHLGDGAPVAGAVLAHHRPQLVALVLSPLIHAAIRLRPWDLLFSLPYRIDLLLLVLLLYFSIVLLLVSVSVSIWVSEGTAAEDAVAEDRFAGHLLHPLLVLGQPLRLAAHAAALRLQGRSALSAGRIATLELG